MAAKDTIDLWKSIVDLLKGVALPFVVVSLFAFPSLVNRAARSFGIEEFDLWGFKGKTSLAQVADAVEAQRSANAELSNRLNKTDEALKKVTLERDESKKHSGRSPASASPPSGQGDYAIQQIIESNVAALAIAAEVRSQSAQVLQRNASVIAAAQDAVAGADARWVVIFGSDPTEDAARAELDRARKAGFDEARIYFNKKRYPSGVEFPSRKTAVDALVRIQSLSATAKGAYPQNLATWRPKSAPRSSDLVDCL